MHKELKTRYFVPNIKRLKPLYVNALRFNQQALINYQLDIAVLIMVRYKILALREQGTGNREQGIGNRE
ncbi:hypothetical protein AFK68_28790 [Hydrocoleum sp. CS-953]|nr:hypothetical protein AFK68_28790 [Hydrocoleum sp. CS-953]